MCATKLPSLPQICHPLLTCRKLPHALPMERYTKLKATRETDWEKLPSELAAPNVSVKEPKRMAKMGLRGGGQGGAQRKVSVSYPKPHKALQRHNSATTLWDAQWVLLYVPGTHQQTPLPTAPTVPTNISR